MAPVRVLCLGYSATEQPGYVDFADELATADGVFTFIKAGWSGHSIKGVAYMIDEILETIKCDVSCACTADLQSAELSRSSYDATGVVSNLRRGQPHGQQMRD